VIKIPSENQFSSALRIVPHESFEGLLDALCKEIGARPLSPRPHPVVVPSVAFKDDLQLGIADRRGICMGLNFLTSAVFATRVTAQRDDSPWSKERLAWRILPHAEKFAEQLGVDVAEATPREMFAVSSLLADQLDQYGHFRPEMIRVWQAGRAFFPATNANEGWQRELWAILKDELGESFPHPAVALERLKNDEAFRERMRREYPSVTLVGTGTIDPLLVEVLQLLQHVGSEITLHVLLPTLEYLGDLKKGRKMLAALREDPETIQHEAPHPLLASMGRHAAGSFCLLQELDEEMPEWPEISSGENSQPGCTLLRYLQNDIRKLSSPQKVDTRPDDRSIGIHSCFGPRREMEVLRDEILRAFRDLPDLQPADIHVITPSLDVYAPLISAVLEQVMHHGVNAGQHEALLRVRVTELPKIGQIPLIAAVLALLEMAAAGRYEASALLELLHLEPVQRALGIRADDEELERLRMRIRDSGVTRGLGEAGQSAETGTWQCARERLVAGLWMGHDGAPRFQAGGFVLPVAEDLAGDTHAIRSFAGWFSKLQDTMRQWSSGASAAEWAVRLRRALSELLGCSDGEELTMRPHLLFLGAVDSGAFVDAGTIFDWLDTATEEDRRRSPVSGKITFGRFRQLQNLPCRVLAMVGLHEGTFPSGSRVPAWDLLQAKPKPWDRNPRVDDRQLFLDAILAPRDRLIIAGATRNVRTNESEPFSPCVDELVRVLCTMTGGERSLLTDHPLQPFSQDYFRDHAAVARSFSKTNESVARGIAEAGGARRARPFYVVKETKPDSAGQTADEPVALEITIKELAAFWKDPAKAFIKAQGISVWRDEEDDRDLDLSPVEVKKLQEWGINESIVREITEGDGDLEMVKARLRANRKLPKGLLGDRLWEQDKEKAEKLGWSIKQTRGRPLPIACLLPLSNNTDGLPDITVKVTGQLHRNTENDHLLVWDPGKAEKAKHFLEPWFGAMFAARESHEFRLPTIFLNLENPDPSTKNTFNALVPADADMTDDLDLIVRIQGLVSGYLLGRTRPLCYAPATSEEIAKHLEGTAKKPPLSLADAVAKARKANWEPTSSSAEGSPSDGESEAAQLAWRDADPFEDIKEWERWVNAVAKPLRVWRKH
jgi:exodeoxyribonuclease V gamma subunit